MKYNKETQIEIEYELSHLQFYLKDMLNNKNKKKDRDITLKHLLFRINKLQTLIMKDIIK
jgi:hypothetical protein